MICKHCHDNGYTVALVGNRAAARPCERCDKGRRTLREWARQAPAPAAPTDAPQECNIAFSADKAQGKVFLQFDQHVRCLSLDDAQAVELMENVAKMLAELGVVLTNDGPDGVAQTH